MKRLMNAALSRRGILAAVGSAFAVRPALAAERTVRVGVPRAPDEVVLLVVSEGRLRVVQFV